MTFSEDGGLPNRCARGGTLLPVSLPLLCVDINEQEYSRGGGHSPDVLRGGTPGHRTLVSWAHTLGSGQPHRFGALSSE